jgi:hypothetical protein
MTYLLRLLVASVTLSTVWGCTSGQTAAIPNIATPNIAATSTLQFAVGTATIGTAGGTSTLGLNVVATFRQPNGNNATGVNTPTLIGPAGLTFGSLLGNSNRVSGITPAQLSALGKQVVANSFQASNPIYLAMASGFGPFVGVFGYGLAGDNLVANSDLNNLLTINVQSICYGIASSYVSEISSSLGSGNSGSFYGSVPNVGVQGLSSTKELPGDLVRSAELALPINSGSASGNCSCPSTCTQSGPLNDSAFPVQYFGGPPAWPSPQGYGNYSYFVGYPLGFTDFASSPVPGTYELSVSYPTSANYSSSGVLAKSAKLPASSVAAPLAVFPEPTLIINSDGSGVVSVNVPSGLREAVVTVVTNDCDLAGRDLQASNYYNHYALVTKTSGPQNLFLSSLLGPPSTVTGKPTHTFCTASDVQAYNGVAGANGATLLTSYPISTIVAAVGFDYPAYESSYPFTSSAAPTITNGAGQADITTSYPLHVSTNIIVPASGS